MAEHRDLTKILDNVEEDLKHAHPPAQPPARASSASVVESFAPQKYRNAGDSMEQIQQDFRKAVSELDSRSKALIDELKRMAN